ncbi:hypothetical protein JCM3770_004618 [Rhodotorula araucariae]
MHIHQADGDKAYLHGELDEELYMRIPEGINDLALAGKVLKLDRALYGRKQAGPSGTTASTRRWGASALYVDDLLFVSPSLDEITRIKTGLKEEYGIKDLGEARFILGNQIHRCAYSGVFLSQRAYLEDVLLRLGQAGCRTAPTPMIPLSQLHAVPEDHTPSPLFRCRYLQAVGSPMYVMLGTCLTLPTPSASSGGTRTAWTTRTIEYVPDDTPLVGFKAYSNLAWGACVDTVRSTMGYAFVLASGAVSWLSKLQPRVTASSTEAEYLSLSHASKEAVFLRQLLDEFGHNAPGPATLLGDNQDANALSREAQFHDCTRHLRLTEHFVLEQVEQGVIAVTYIPTAHMVADAMTKSLPAPAFVGHRAALGVKPLRARGGVAAEPQT